MVVAVVGVGSNLGSREASIRTACAMLDARKGIEVNAVSPLYDTEPLGPPQPRYLNAAFRLDTVLSPPELLAVLLRTEKRLGRDRRDTERWTARSLDLDLLWDERGPHASLDLQVPHPELEKRNFALTPLLAVAPELQPVYASSLSRTEGELVPWDRAATSSWQSRAGTFANDVEADTLVDACALATVIPKRFVQPLSTLHRTIDSSASAFADAFREISRAGFSVAHATISHCSNTQWAAHFHGANLAIPMDGDVRFETTSGTSREFRARLSFQNPPR